MVLANFTSLAIYLGDPGAVPGIGHEHGGKPTSGIGRYISPHGSFRYVWYEPRVPLGALQVVTLDGRHATIANVYVVPARRRSGIATALLARAQRDFKEIAHAPKENLSTWGRAWRDSFR